MKSRLKLILRAGSTVVAESQDPLLWQSVLAAITGGDPGEVALGGGGAGGVNTAASPGRPVIAGPELRSFCRMVQAPTEAARAALDPSRHSPFLQLNEAHFNTFRAHVPQRGPKAITGSVLAATLLALWFKFAKLGAPTVFQVKQILAPLGVEDRNAYRSVKNCDWLMLKEGRIHLHPIQTAEAFHVARAYIESVSVYGNR